MGHAPLAPPPAFMERTPDDQTPPARLLPRQFRVRPDEMEALKAMAVADRISDSEVVRRALRAFLVLDSPKIDALNVKVYITSADYPRTNHPSPFPSGRSVQPDLTFTIAVDVHGITVVPETGFLAIPDYDELQRLLVEPVAAAINTALA